MEVGLGEGIEIFRNTFGVGKLSPEEDWRHAQSERPRAKSFYLEAGRSKLDPTTSTYGIQLNKPVKALREAQDNLGEFEHTKIKESEKSEGESSFKLSCAVQQVRGS